MEDKNLSEQMAEVLNGLTDEQKEKANACKTFEELITLLGEMNVSLPDELMDEVAGGGQYVFYGSEVPDVPTLPLPIRQAGEE